MLVNWSRSILYHCIHRLDRSTHWGRWGGNWGLTLTLSWRVFWHQEVFGGGTFHPVAMRWVVMWLLLLFCCYCCFVDYIGSSGVLSQWSFAVIRAVAFGVVRCMRRASLFSRTRYHHHGSGLCGNIIGRWVDSVARIDVVESIWHKIAETWRLHNCINYGWRK